MNRKEITLLHIDTVQLNNITSNTMATQIEIDNEVFALFYNMMHSDFSKAAIMTLCALENDEQFEAYVKEMSRRENEVLKEPVPAPAPVAVPEEDDSDDSDSDDSEMYEIPPLEEEDAPKVVVPGINMPTPKEPEEPEEPKRGVSAAIAMGPEHIKRLHAALAAVDRPDEVTLSLFQQVDSLHSMILEKEEEERIAKEEAERIAKEEERIAKEKIAKEKAEEISKKMEEIWEKMDNLMSERNTLEKQLKALNLNA